jgi:hypothetical protein
MAWIPGLLPQLYAVKRTGPQPSGIDTVRKVPENAAPVRDSFP